MTNKVTMANGKEIEFGKRKVLVNVKHDETGVLLHAAHADGEFRTHHIPTEDLGNWAAYGLKHFVKAQAITSSKDFDEKSLKWSNPLDADVRVLKGTAALPIESALVQVTGKTLDAVRAFLGGKNRKEVNALKADPRIAPVYAALQADLLARQAAARAAKKPADEATESPADLLAELA
jgi:hypothetical protein